MEVVVDTGFGSFTTPSIGVERYENVHYQGGMGAVHEA